MKLSKKVIITLFSVILVVGLTGCGSQTTETPKSTQTEKAPEAQKPAEPTKPAETQKPTEPTKPTKPTTAPGAPAVEEEDCNC